MNETKTVTDEATGKKRVVHTPKPRPAVMRDMTTANEEPQEVVLESRQVRRANARRQEKQIRRHMNEVVLKKNRKRGAHG